MQKSLVIYSLVTNKENLSYFGAKLLKIGDTFKMVTPHPLIISKMAIGKNYVTGYLLKLTASYTFVPSYPTNILAPVLKSWRYIRAGLSRSLVKLN